MIKNLKGQVNQIGSMAANLKSDQKSSMAAVNQINENISQAVKAIRKNERIKKKEIDRIYNGLVDQIKKELGGVKNKIEKQKVAEEQAKLRKLQEEMEAERKRKEAEAAAAKQVEDERKQRMEIEARRKEDEEKRKKQEERDNAQAAVLQKGLDQANARLAEQIEQERRDHELALRLATENNSTSDIENLTPSLKRSSLVNAQRETEANKKYNLAKWKYADLRDTINTSCDIELLEACREEFHRRLKVYHAWKAKNKKKNSTFDENMRAPTSILNEANKSSSMANPKKTTSSTAQR